MVAESVMEGSLVVKTASRAEHVTASRFIGFLPSWGFFLLLLFIYLEIIDFFFRVVDERCYFLGFIYL